MHICRSLIMLATLSCTALNAAAELMPATHGLFALYNPTRDCCDEVRLRGSENTTNKTLTLTITQHDVASSSTIRLSGNELFIKFTQAQYFQTALTYDQHDLSKATLPAKLSLLINETHTSSSRFRKTITFHNYHRGIPAPYISNKFLLLHGKSGHNTIGLDNTLRSVTTVKDALTCAQTAFPIAIVDISIWLKSIFGDDWRYKLPIYRDPDTNKTMTQTEYDALYPKTVAVKKL